MSFRFGTSKNRTINKRRNGTSKNGDSSVKKNNLQTEVINDLERRKKRSREFLRPLSPEEKIAKLVELQERYYAMLKAREQNGGRAIPGKMAEMAHS